MDFPVTRWVYSGVSDGGKVLLCGHKQEFDVCVCGRNFAGSPSLTQLAITAR